MAEFALIFHVIHPPAPETLPARNAAAREWALVLRAQGVLKHAFPFEEEAVVVSAQKTTHPHSELASVLVVEAADLQAVVALASGHPGMKFGTEIEIRPVKSVAPAQQQK